MTAPTYEIGKPSASGEEYLAAVGHLADWVTEAGKSLDCVVRAYGDFVESTGREARRSHAEYLLESLMLGVLWRSRGNEATATSAPRQRLVTEIVRERRANLGKRRDASTAALVQLRPAPERAKHDPSPQEIQQLLDWLLASGEYDDECQRLEGWILWLSSPPAAASREILRFACAFAMLFEKKSAKSVGSFHERRRALRVGGIVDAPASRGYRAMLPAHSRISPEHGGSRIAQSRLANGFPRLYAARGGHAGVLTHSPRRHVQGQSGAKRTQVHALHARLRRLRRYAARGTLGRRRLCRDSWFGLLAVPRIGCALRW